MNFRQFKSIVFKCKWFEGYVNRRIILHDIPSGHYANDFTQYLPQEKEPYVLPQHCNQIGFCLDVLDEKMWFVIDCDPRGKHVVHLLNKDDNDN